MASKNNPSAFYGNPYNTVDDAAAAALMALGYQPRVHNQEYMGMIVKNPADGKYYRTDFQTQGDRMNSSWRGYPGGQVAAIVHSHPAQQMGDKYPHTDFSSSDVSSADQLHVPNYIAAMQPDGSPSQERRYTQGESKPLTYGAQGDRFLAEYPIDEQLQFIERNRMGDTVKHSPAITAAQRKAMVEAMVNQAQQPGAMKSMPEPPQGMGKPRAKDMGGAPRPLPPGTNTFGPPIDPPLTGGVDAAHAALINALRARGMPQ